MHKHHPGLRWLALSVLAIGLTHPALAEINLEADTIVFRDTVPQRAQ